RDSILAESGDFSDPAQFLLDLWQRLLASPEPPLDVALELAARSELAAHATRASCRQLAEALSACDEEDAALLLARLLLPHLDALTQQGRHHLALLLTEALADAALRHNAVAALTATGR